MNNPEELRREIEVLRDCMSKLTVASLRISASADVSTVLREVVERARALTGARYGGIATMNDSGQCEEFVTSGFTPAEYRRMTAWPDAPRLFQHFRDLPGVLRSPDLHSYVRSHGFSTKLMPSKSFQGTPMYHRGMHIGNFFVCGKEGGPEFTSEDEEVLLMFAAQAATAIANARALRNEQRVRADMQALVDISPVGVAVFDARFGKTVSFNREAKRIVEGLLEPGQPPEELLKVVTLRRPDGTEVSLQEFPVAQALSSASTISAEEIVLQVPDGRRVTMLMNAAPIRSEDGTIESVVVTMQDLAPRKELGRLRADFLGMVSHELRAPLTSIKGSAANLMSALETRNPAEILQFIRIIDEQADHMRSLISDLVDAGQIETGTLSVDPEPTDVARLVDQARNRFLSGGGRHPVRVDLPLNIPRVMADRRRIVQVMNNLISNAALNSSESSPVRIAASCDAVHVAVSISDEGRGVPAEMLPHLFRKYMRVGADRGVRESGLGLAICKGLVEAHGGRIWAESAGEGLGTRFTFTIPVAEEPATRDGFGFESEASIPPRKGREQAPILMVGDDPQTVRYVRDTLAAAGYSSLVTDDPQELAHLVRTTKPRLVLLDMMLAGTDGIEMLQSVPEMADRPVIFVSGYGRDEMIARALDIGAADYIVKPFSRTELAARVRAALRRTAEPPGPFRLGDLVIDYQDRRVRVADRQLKLTATEYEILRLLSVNAGRAVRYASLFRQVWGRRYSGDSRPIRSIVKNLRRKLGDNAASPAYIFNDRQVGYRMPLTTSRLKPNRR